MYWVEVAPKAQGKHARPVPAFAYVNLDDPIRPDLAAAHRRAWERISRPGTWLDGAERVAVAAAARDARDCPLCAERKQALSPYAVDGRHAGESALPEALLDAVHRVASDAGRLTGRFVEKLQAAGVSDAHYVEAVGVTVQLLSIDAVHRGLGIALEPLPAPQEGVPSRHRPAGAASEGFFVPMVKPSQLEGEDQDLFGGRVTGNVIRALSLVPDEVRALTDLSAAQYLTPKEMMRFDSPRAIDRAQIELVAGRISALNECFY